MDTLTVGFQKTAWGILAATALATLCGSISLHAQASKKRSVQKAGAFSYYMLVLSYAPDFCAEPGGDKETQECGAGRHIGFVVHGLWPENNTGRGPENCGSAGTVPADVINATLSYIPTASLIRHEWQTHGTCSGLDAASFFALVRKARDSVQIPDDLNQPGQQIQLGQTDIQSKMAGANPTFAQEDFRVSCYRDSNLEEVRVCLNRDLSPRACTVSAGQCNAKTVSLQPVR
jgi:ribonuclease T2